jgi:hypothetical protein
METSTVCGTEEKGLKKLTLFPVLVTEATTSAHLAVSTSTPSNTKCPGSEAI